MRKIVFLLVGISLFLDISAQQRDTYKPFIPEIRNPDLKECIDYLSSPALSGREAGTVGERKAAEWIEGKMKSYGLTGFANNQDPFVQPFRFYKSLLKDAILYCGTDTLYNKRDFYLAPFQQGIQQFDLIYVGTGTEKELDKVNVNGKIAVVQPIGWLYSSTFPGKTPTLWELIGFLEKRHAAGIMYAYPDEMFKAIPLTDSYEAFRVLYDLPEQNPAQRDTFHYFLTTKKTLSCCIGMKVSQLRDSVLSANRKKRSLAGQFSGRISVSVNVLKEKVSSLNVLGMVEGRNKKDELVVISAHYDHLGKKGDAYFPGADDNASGVSALLSLARLFSKASLAGYRPDRTIVFAAYSAEEDGELGSSWFVRNLHKKVVLNLNMDMIGRRDTLHAQDDHYVYFLTDAAQRQIITMKLNDARKKYEPGIRLDPHLNEDDFLDYFNRSDQRSFSVEGIPFVVFTTGEHEDYHQITDTPAKVNQTTIREIAVLVGSLAWDYANGNLQKQ